MKLNGITFFVGITHFLLFIYWNFAIANPEIARKIPSAHEWRIAVATKILNFIILE